MEEFDFNAGRLVSHRAARARGRAGLRRTLAVVAVVCLLTGLAGVVAEHEFWWLTLTGRRAAGHVTARQEHIIGWAFTGRGAAAGRAYPITVTEFRFTVVDAAGVERPGSFRFPGSCEAFKVGDALGIMYPRFGDGPGVPSAWGLYAEHDPAWLMFTLVGASGLTVAVACWWWRRHLGRQWPQVATLQTGGATEPST